jgi:hypothetical protein
MRHLPAISLHPMTFLQAFAGGLHAACAPVPEYLAALMRRLSADRDVRSGEEPNHGPRATKTSSRIDRRGRR